VTLAQARDDLVRELRPDRGGNEDMARLINDAWRDAKRELT